VDPEPPSFPPLSSPLARGRPLQRVCAPCPHAASATRLLTRACAAPARRQRQPLARAPPLVSRSSPPRCARLRARAAWIRSQPLCSAPLPRARCSSRARLLRPPAPTRLLWRLRRAAWRRERGGRGGDKDGARERCRWWGEKERAPGRRETEEKEKRDFPRTHA
jgi:hypothetical protein